MTTTASSRLDQILEQAAKAQKSPLEQFGLSPSANKLIGGLAALGEGGVALGALGAAGAGTAAEGESTEGEGTAEEEEKTASKSSSGGGASGLSSLAKDATSGAVLTTLINGGYAKYTAIWVGLFILALVLITKGLGFSAPNATKIVPVPE